MTPRLGLPRWSRAQWLLRAAVWAGLAVALFSTGLAGRAPTPLLAGTVLSLGLVFALAPRSGIGVGAMGLVLVWWATGPDDPLHPGLLVAGAGLVTAHLAAMLAADGPGRSTPQRRLVLMWVRRGFLVWAPLPVLYAVARGLRGAPATAYVWSAALAVLVAVVLVVSARVAEPEEPPLVHR